VEVEADYVRALFFFLFTYTHALLTCPVVFVCVLGLLCGCGARVVCLRLSCSVYRYRRSTYMDVSPAARGARVCVLSYIAYIGTYIRHINIIYIYATPTRARARGRDTHASRLTTTTPRSARNAHGTERRAVQQIASKDRSKIFARDVPHATHNNTHYIPPQALSSPHIQITNDTTPLQYLLRPNPISTPTHQPNPSSSAITSLTSRCTSLSLGGWAHWSRWCLAAFHH